MEKTLEASIILEGAQESFEPISDRLKGHESVHPLHGRKQIISVPSVSSSSFWALLLGCPGLPLPVEIRLSLHAAPHIFWNRKGGACSCVHPSLASLLPSSSFYHHMAYVALC